MNIERKVYDLVKNYPQLKDFIKYSYQYFWGFFTKKRHQVLSEFVVREGSFFGFHDKSPWSSDNNFLLAHSFSGIGNECLSRIKSVDICLYSGDSWLDKKVIGSTRAFNWQQGSQLQWLSNHEIIFNDFIDGQCLARIINCDGEFVKNLNHPIGAISSRTRKYCGFSFEDFGLTMPGYGYDFGFFDSKSTVPYLHLVIGDIDNPDSFNFIDCTKLKDSIFNDINEGRFCLSHALFSPLGGKLTFMKRLSRPGCRLQSELYVYDCITESLVRLPFKDMVSHYTYLDENNILVYANTDSGDNFFIVNLLSLELTNVSNLTNNRDGHPSSSLTGRVVFDTYPDRSRHQNLYLWDNKFEKAMLIAKLYAPINFKDASRVDLHPRIRQDGCYVSFDTSFNGFRSFATMRLPK